MGKGDFEEEGRSLRTCLVDTDVSCREIRRCIPKGVSAVMAMVLTGGAGILFSSPAAADPPSNLKEAVVSARGSTQCGPLRYDPVVEHAADIVNRSTDEFVGHTARNVPADGPTDALPILKDLGSGANKALSLQGAGRDSNDGDAIKMVVLEGGSPGVFKVLDKHVAAFSDCSYTDFGVSLRHNAETGFSLAVVVLAGK